MSASKKANRRWNDDYIAFGFTCVTEEDGTERPKCMVCNVVLSNGNLKPSGMREHIKSTRHQNHVRASVDTLKLESILPSLSFPNSQEPDNGNSEVNLSLIPVLLKG